MLAFAILLAYDYFPGNPLTQVIPARLIIFLILGLVLVSIMFKRYRNMNNKEAVTWELFFISYFVFLLILYSLLGGQSSSGIDFSNGILWVLLGISLIQIYIRSKKIKVQEIHRECKEG